MVKAIINGKRFDSDKDWLCVYSDGAFRKSRGVDYYAKKVKDEVRVVVHHWTNWQGESDNFQYLTDIAEIIAQLQGEKHPERVNKAVEEIEELSKKSLLEEL